MLSLHCVGMGEAVNHQYDKAFPWELDAHHYTRRYISQGIYYFSGKSLVACLQVQRKLASAHSVALSQASCTGGRSRLRGSSAAPPYVLQSCNAMCEMETLLAPERVSIGRR
jgi:hypothetical protein